MRWLRWIAAWLGALLLRLLRATCRIRIINFQGEAMRERGQRYVYALQHAHQVGGIMGNPEPRLAAMVSRSADGDLLVPFLKLHHTVAVRGSTRKRGKDKGGRKALEALEQLITEQQVPAAIAVDGPQGPRGTVHRGVADLALQTQAVIIPSCVTASRKWILKRTWDRLQIPKPFSTITLLFGEPIIPSEDTEGLRQKVASTLYAMEREQDPDEARIAQLSDHAQETMGTAA